MVIPPDHDQSSKEQPSHQQEPFFFSVLQNTKETINVRNAKS